MDDTTKKELQSAAFERLIQHLRERKDVQNLDLMNLAGFCRNCLSKWYREEAKKKGIEILDSDARKHVYGMPYEDWKKNVPIRDYEDLIGYIQQIIDGKENILWPGKPIYFCKTSGTTSGTKHIPISKESMPNHITAARDAILTYIAETKNTTIVNGKMIFLQGELLAKDWCKNKLLC